MTAIRNFACAAVLFDLDGVLVDSRAAVERQWKRWAEEHGLDSRLVIPIAHGRPTIDTIAILAPHLDKTAEARQMEQREIEDTGGVRAIPGAAELLAGIPAERWAVVTSGTRALATARLRHVGLPSPKHLVPADEVLHGKPDPEPYIKAAKLLGVSARECVVIEDSPFGIEAGKSAGAAVLAVPTTYPRPELAAADVLVERLSDIRASVTSNGLLLQARLAGT